MSSSASSSNLCVICNSRGRSKPNAMKKKGLTRLLNNCLLKNEMLLHDNLVEMQNSGVPAVIHHDCRRRFNDNRKRKGTPEPMCQQVKRTRSWSAEDNFDWKTFCFLCEKKKSIHVYIAEVVYVRLKPLRFEDAMLTAPSKERMRGEIVYFKFYKTALILSPLKPFIMPNVP